MRRLDVAIVGAGTAGAAAALFLARTGHQVTLYERVEAPTAVGAGIILQPSGLAVLRALQLESAVLAHGERLDRLVCERPDGKQVLQLDYARLDPALFGLGLHRGVLFDALYGAARTAPGVTVRTGVAVATYREGPDGVSLVAEGGEALGQHALLVVADGARSVLRASFPHVARVTAYPYGALWFLADDPEDLFRSQLFQVVRGTRRLIGLLPTGRPVGGKHAVTSLFYSLAERDLGAWRARGLEAFKADVLADVPRAAPVLEQLHDLEQVLFSGYLDVVLSPWHTQRVVVLGDAAHATSPQLGQGCNLALVDACTLAEVLAACADDDVGAALADYTRRRRRHLAWYQLATRWLTPFFQSDLDVLAPLRDVLLPLAGRLPLAGTEMIASMCGVSRGPLLRRLEPPRALLAG